MAGLLYVAEGWSRTEFARPREILAAALRRGGAGDGDGDEQENDEDTSAPSTGCAETDRDETDDAAHASAQAPRET